jgi:nucleotide-binding universal stress UspA family protein
MTSIEIRTILVATDLTDGSDRLVRTASSIAALSGAQLHLVHVQVMQTESSAGSSVDASREEEAVRLAQRELDELGRRAIPSQVTPASLSVVTGGSPSELIRKKAEELAVDLVLIGPHAGEESDRPFLGSTADRLVRTAGVPCLVVRGDLEFPVRRLGALIDFSPASQAALETATSWASAFSGGSGSGVTPESPRISVAHIAWKPNDVDQPEREERWIRPELDRAIARAAASSAGEPPIEFVPEVLRPGAAPEVVESWVHSMNLAMVVLGTSGGHHLPDAYLGELAATVVRTAPCSVLLVPPHSGPGGALHSDGRLRLRRIVTGVDFHESSWEGALWAMRSFAPDAHHELVHVVDMPELPGPLRAIGGTREQLRLAAHAGAQRRLEELRDLGSSPNAGIHIASGKPAAEIVRVAVETNADLVVVGEQGPRHGLGVLLGSTAERILFDSPVPVLLARKVRDEPPRRILVALDSSEVATRVLDWAATLLRRFDADATVIHVVDRVLLVDELVGLPSADRLHETETKATDTMRTWLDEQVGKAGLPADRVRTHVGIGDPSYEIIAAARQEDVDLVLIGSRGDDIAPTPLIGRIVNKVVRSAPCSVLVVAPGQPGVSG